MPPTSSSCRYPRSSRDRPVTSETLRGTVVNFDDRLGLGVVEAAQKSAPEIATRFGFHCTQIADGSRRIAPGTKVTFVVVARHGGVWEAAELQPL